MSLAPGDLVLDRYVIDVLLGRGGMGEVYRAHHAVLKHEVAIKVLHGPHAPIDTARFIREAQAMARVRHRCVTAILDLGRLPSGAPCLAMEYVEGTNLEDLLAKRKTIAWPRAVELVIQALDGLQAIHEAGIIHRDIKTANLMVIQGVREELKVMDFGISRLLDDGPKLTRTNSTLGTPAYMAPEQAVSSVVDERADLYSLALVLFECITGAVPYAETGMMAPVQRIYNQLPEPVAPVGRPVVPPQLAAIVLKTLAPEPSERPASARELANLLRATLAEADVGPSPPSAAAATSSSLSVRVVTGARSTTPEPARTPSPTDGPALRGTPPHATTVRGMSAPARFQTPPGRPAQTRPPTPAPTSGTLLFVARLPPSRLQAAVDRRWLAELAVGGRAFSLGGYLWVVLFEEVDAAAATKHATALIERLRERYGGLIASDWEHVDRPIELTPAMLTGGAQLPPELTALVERQSAAARPGR